MWWTSCKMQQDLSLISNDSSLQVPLNRGTFYVLRSNRSSSESGCQMAFQDDRHLWIVWRVEHELSTYSQLEGHS
jgi:hypothetical protein